MGVEGRAPSKSTPLHEVFQWNEHVHEDKEFQELESLAPDVQQVANTTLSIFTHLINDLLQPDTVLSEEAKQWTLFTLKNLQHVSAEHFACITRHLAQQRKLKTKKRAGLKREIV